MPFTYTATFEPEVWVNDWAAPVDEPTERIDVTELLTTDPRLAGLRTKVDLDEEVIDKEDLLWEAFGPDCQAHARLHPFTIRVRRED